MGFGHSSGTGGNQSTQRSSGSTANDPAPSRKRNWNAVFAGAEQIPENLEAQYRKIRKAVLMIAFLGSFVAYAIMVLFAMWHWIPVAFWTVFVIYVVVKAASEPKAVLTFLGLGALMDGLPDFDINAILGLGEGGPRFPNTRASDILKAGWNYVFKGLWIPVMGVILYLGIFALLFMFVKPSGAGFWEALLLPPFISLLILITLVLFRGTKIGKPSTAKEWGFAVVLVLLAIATAITFFRIYDGPAKAEQAMTTAGEMASGVASAVGTAFEDITSEEKTTAPAHPSVAGTVYKFTYLPGSDPLNLRPLVLPAYIKPGRYKVKVTGEATLIANLGKRHEVSLSGEGTANGLPFPEVGMFGIVFDAGSGNFADELVVKKGEQGKARGAVLNLTKSYRDRIGPNLGDWKIELPAGIPVVLSK